MSVDPASVAAHLSTVRERINRALAGDRRDVRIVCVTKGFGPDALDAVRLAGGTDIGESYAQELVAKAAHREQLRVHFIGRLQTNKVRSVASIVDLWQSVDRRTIAEEIARRAPGASVLVQLNSTQEPSKGGCEPDDAGPLVDACRALGLDVRGVMTIGRTGPVEATRPGFALTRSIADRLGLAECSMGMTDDLEIAVQEGATMVRVGSALFGPRPVAAHAASENTRPATLR